MKIEENITFVKNKLDKKNYHDSSKTVDLVCELEDEIYNIEMNNNTSTLSLERNISYINDLYKSKMKRGSEYRKDVLNALEEEIIGLYDKELHQEMLRNIELHHAEEKGIKSCNIEITKAMLREEEPLEKITNISETN